MARRRDGRELCESSASDATAVSKTGAGTLATSSIVAQGSASYGTTLTVSAGSIVTR